jgi:hypothetical protein
VLPLRHRPRVIGRQQTTAHEEAQQTTQGVDRLIEAMKSFESAHT